MDSLDMFDWDSLIVKLDEVLAERPNVKHPSPVEWSA